jgi:hypothetical protein
LNEASVIPHSIRPAILKQLIGKAESLNDGFALVVIGDMMESESKLWADCGNDPIGGSNCRELLLVQGAQLQMKGWSLLKKEKEAGKVGRKHKYNLSKYGPMVGATPAGAWPNMPQEDSTDPAYVLWTDVGKKVYLEGPVDKQHSSIWIKGKQ